MHFININIIIGPNPNLELNPVRVNKILRVLAIAWWSTFATIVKLNVNLWLSKHGLSIYSNVQLLLVACTTVYISCF